MPLPTSLLGCWDFFPTAWWEFVYRRDLTSFVMSPTPEPILLFVFWLCHVFKFVYSPIYHSFSDCCFLFPVGFYRFVVFAVLRKTLFHSEMIYKRYSLTMSSGFGFYVEVLTPPEVYQWKVCEKGSDLCLPSSSQLLPHHLFNKQLCTMGLKHHLSHMLNSLVCWHLFPQSRSVPGSVCLFLLQPDSFTGE